MNNKSINVLYIGPQTFPLGAATTKRRRYMVDYMNARDIQSHYLVTAMGRGRNPNTPEGEYGLCIPHYGTIVVGNSNHIGPYATLHTSTCITDTCRRIGKGLLLATGAKITGGEVLGDHITVAANSVVTRSFSEGNALLVGIPAFKKKEYPVWYSSLTGEWKRRVDEVENLKTKMGIE